MSIRPGLRIFSVTVRDGILVFVGKDYICTYRFGNMRLASVCGRRAEEVERRRRDGGNGAGAQRRRRAADGSPPLMRSRPCARDEGACCVAERAWARGGIGPTDSPLSEATRALVTAELEHTITSH
jgi:hypothetical protein